MSNPWIAPGISLHREMALLALVVTGIAAMPAVASEPHAEDWASPRSIVHALHETISARPGEQRDWDRYRDLFLDGAMVSMEIKSPREPGESCLRGAR